MNESHSLEVLAHELENLRCYVLACEHDIAKMAEALIARREELPQLDARIKDIEAAVAALKGPSPLSE